MLKVQDRPLSIPKFTVIVALQYVAVLLVYRFGFPTTWEREMSAGPGWIVLAILMGHGYGALVEWTFHRWFLHSIILPFVFLPFQILVRFVFGHREHHDETNIQTKEISPGRWLVTSHMEMTEHEQFAGSSFPPYALIGFMALAILTLTPFHLLWPYAPIYFGGLTGFTISYYGYESVHTIDHYPYSWWKKKVEHPYFGWFWKSRLGWHQKHHQDKKKNMMVFGFFWIEVWDWILRTAHYVQNLLLHNDVVTYEDVDRGQKTWPFVTAVDNWVVWCEARIRDTKVWKARSIERVKKIQRMQARRANK